MDRPSVSIVIPAFNEEARIAETIARISGYFASTGLRHEIVVVDDGSTDGTASVVESAARRDASVRLLVSDRNQGKGSAVRRGVLEARGETIAFVDADFPYETQNLGDSVALVQSGVAEIAIGSRTARASAEDPSYSLSRRVAGRILSLAVRSFFVRRGIYDAQCGLKAFDASAAAVLFGDSKLAGFAFDVEILYLADKYGYRIARVPVVSRPHQRRLRVTRESLRMARDLLSVWRNDRRRLYRPPRRCPVCFSVEVWTVAQLGEQVVRVCRRCRCRFLSSFASRYEDEAARPQLPSSPPAAAAWRLEDLTPSERRMLPRRVALLKKHVSPGGRVLELGAGAGRLGTMLSREFDYVGIELSDESCREARARGIEVYRSRLSSFVNTGGPFDAVTMFRVFEKLEDPHDALGKVSELLRPGGILAIVTPDTESVLALLSRDRWFAYDEPDAVIFYSRSGLVELLERSGYEILSVSADIEHATHDEIMARVGRIGRLWGVLSRALVRTLPSPFPVSIGGIRIVARRRGTTPFATRPLRAAESSHAR
ncbi:MAG: bifunctional glycosyltransferase/class I SAM-dependent methyltransferase [Thermoanaerobaculia bacterium]|nr:bifunctional glycosyltransferase/class I SAM-dependent methyltransferase [Thermoanaerobaculia bacterium]